MRESEKKSRRPSTISVYSTKALQIVTANREFGTLPESVGTLKP